MTNSTLQVGTMVWLNTQGKEIRAQNKLGKIQTICTSDEMVAQHGQDFLYMVDEIRSLPIENSPLVYGIRMAGPWAVGTFQERDTLWIGHEQLSSLVRAVRTEAGQKLRALRDTRAMTACYNQSVRVPIAKGEILVCTDKYGCNAGRIVLKRTDGSNVTTADVRALCPSGQGVVNQFIFEVVS